MKRITSLVPVLGLAIAMPALAQFDLVEEHLVRQDDGLIRIGPDGALRLIKDEPFYNPSVVLEVDGKFYGYAQTADLDFDGCKRDRIWSFAFDSPGDLWDWAVSAINGCSDPYPELSPSTGTQVWGVGSLLKTPNRVLLTANHGRNTDVPPENNPVSEEGGRWFYYSEQSLGRRIGEWRLFLSAANTKYIIFDPVAFSLPLNNGDRRFGAFFVWYDVTAPQLVARTGYLVHDFTTDVTDVLTTIGMVRVRRSGGYRLSPSVELANINSQIPDTQGEFISAVLMNEGIVVDFNKYLAFSVYSAAGRPGEHFARGFFYTSWGQLIGFDSKVFSYRRDGVNSTCALESNVPPFVTTVEALPTDPIFENWNKYFWWTQDTECTTWSAVNGPWQFDLVAGRVP